ncbi:MAG: molybdopterin-guanine dinucleotide biosynthesis protein B [Gammaproteobacteria bacterium]|nr:molybdopterin-guanine dinucleotide biosynthesis protein B [Gammaproteobacteria bacterium]MCF6364202.1 molybdopterin-guanine dinucleotide biosynthesis protein B [Gammaproteobacteria bacterium]
MSDTTMSQMPANAHVPVIGFVAFSGTGKTTLLTHMIPHLREQGVRLAAVKHSHHSFDIDTPGKDSYELRKAGADQMLVASQRRWALMVENADTDEEPCLNKLVGHLDQTVIDLILVEGFKHEAFPKIELHRPELGHGLLYPDDANIIAFASTETRAMNPSARPVPFLDLNRPQEIADFLITRFALITDSTDTKG